MGIPPLVSRLSEGNISRPLGMFDVLFFLFPLPFVI